MVYEYAEGNRLISPEHDFEKDTLACVANISKRYMGSKKRSESVENIALKMCIRDSHYSYLCLNVHICGFRPLLF